jgi:amino-acid N-acetyltransferase
MLQEITIKPANATDRQAVLDLLQSQNLPTQDLPAKLENFILAKENGKVIGTIGLEIHGKYALLRSLAVDSTQQGNGLGKTLYKTALELAGQKKVQEVFLITTTAAPFFKKLGFKQIKRTDAPPQIAATAQFTTICASTGVVMYKKVGS